MTYHYENLSPERFQQFCQALLLRTFPTALCLPVAQPDGGRDALLYTSVLSAEHADFIVFQIKFNRRANAEKDPHKWLLSIIEDEAPKLASLIPKGAKEYYLITNVSGTSHPDTGSIDRTNQILRKSLHVPATCWWRDDIDRRLDDAWSIKWTYPELMTGMDMFRALLEAGLSEDQDRRSSAIRAYLTEQYKEDEEVKFKQIELQNKLFDLFIDVPLSANISAEDRHAWYSMEKVHTNADLLDLILDDNDDNLISSLFASSASEHARRLRDEPPVGSATALLNTKFQKKFSDIVLEGAPGQGKSTIVQYVSQVHRIRLLDVSSDLAAIPDHHKNGQVRIPFKIDLRDYATWLNKEHPYLVEGEDAALSDWNKSLEAFLAFQVSFQAGGLSFSVDDLVAVSKHSSVLVVMDGFDEVADIKKREQIVEEIIKGTLRLRSNCLHLQVIITSRPAAFANSPGFPDETYHHFTLGSVSKSQANDYAEKWMSARQLTIREKGAFKRVLSSKLDQPHMRDLARNPMQLAILLSLIHTRGTSLPDKRTALYDSYVELFLSREAEKSHVVREHRELLVDLHQYLGWLLHVEAEEGHHRGSITRERLHEVLVDYLKCQGHNTDLVRDLFAGMVERVVALVSRVEGTFEFEVQPLREYFAARYLYETAPYSPPGKEQFGTKPDRFDTIARDFYWLNVTRFYAGCFSKGELASLVDSLETLLVAEGFKHTSYPRDLAIMLLSDWVFSQQPISLQKVLGLVLGSDGFRFLAVISRSGPRGGSDVALPEKCGRDDLVREGLRLLGEGCQYDFAGRVLNMIRQNGEASQLLRLWREKFATLEDVDEKERWLTYASQLDLMEMISKQEIIDYLQACKEHHHLLEMLLRYERFDVGESSKSFFEDSLNLLLDRVVMSRPDYLGSSVLGQMAHNLDPYPYALALRQSSALPLDEEIFRRTVGRQSKNGRFEFAVEDNGFPSGPACVSFLQLASELRKLPVSEWASSLEPWNQLVEEARSHWGERLALRQIANLAAGIRSKSETGGHCLNLFDARDPLCHRARYARLKSGAYVWWRSQLDSVETEDDSLFALLMLFTWGTPRCLLELMLDVDSLVKKLSPGYWWQLYRILGRSVMLLDRGDNFGKSDFSADEIHANLDARTIANLMLRSNKQTIYSLYSKHLSKYSGTDLHVLEACSSISFELAVSGKARWSSSLEVIRRSYRYGAACASRITYRSRPSSRKGMPIDVAREVCDDPSSYPLLVLEQAEQVCRREVNRKVVAVGAAARKEKWFEVRPPTNN